MAVAAQSVHRPNGFFITKEGWEYVAALSAASVAIGALGGGPVSVDGALGLDGRLSGIRGAAVAAGLGLAGAAAQLAAFWRRPAA
jgi:putative oxidoreductase